MSEDIRVTPDLAVPRLEASSYEEVLQALGDLAVEKGWAKPGYGKALIDREREYPTGLPMVVPIALPHTDAEHVLKAGLGLATLKAPVTFYEMGGSDTEVPVEAVIVILVTDPSHQVSMLSKLISVVQEEDWFVNIREANTPEQLADAFNELLSHH